MTIIRTLDDFQAILNRVAASGNREEVDQASLPDVKKWDRLDSKGCQIHVDRGRWYVLPPAY